MFRLKNPKTIVQQTNHYHDIQHLGAVQEKAQKRVQNYSNQREIFLDK